MDVKRKFANHMNTETSSVVPSAVAQPSIEVRTYEQGLRALDSIEGKDAAPEVKQVLTQLRNFFGDRIAKARPVEKPEDERERNLANAVNSSNRERFAPKALPSRGDAAPREPIGRR